MTRTIWAKAPKTIHFLQASLDGLGCTVPLRPYTATSKWIPFHVAPLPLPLTNKEDLSAIGAQAREVLIDLRTHLPSRSGQLQRFDWRLMKGTRTGSLIHPKKKATLVQAVKQIRKEKDFRGGGGEKEFLLHTGCMSTRRGSQATLCMSIMTPLSTFLLF